MRVKALCSGIALGMVLTGSAFAAPSQTANHWLQRLQSAQGMQNYQGIFVYERKGAFSTHQVWRQVDTQGHLLERFLQLNGPAHEVMRIDHRVTCMSAAVANELAAVDIWPSGIQQMQHLQEWYDVRVLGDSRVADHAAAVLLFTPRDQHRYAVELHVDQDTAIPLKTLLLNEQGQLLERLQFVQFQAQVEQGAAAQAQGWMTPSTDCISVVQADVAVSTAPVLEKDWSVSWVPAGFNLLKSHFKPSSGQAGDVLSQVYSDGLAHFSVFFENIGDLDIEGGRRQLGPTAVVSRKVALDANQLMVTVVGEIPLGSAERIALSVHAEQVHQDD